jgi:hypothetical protein
MYPLWRILSIDVDPQPFLSERYLHHNWVNGQMPERISRPIVRHGKLVNTAIEMTATSGKIRAETRIALASCVRRTRYGGIPITWHEFTSYGHAIPDFLRSSASECGIYTDRLVRKR